MTCGCRGVTTLVHSPFADGWRCDRCARPGRRTGHEVTLAADGALPPPSSWRNPPLCPHYLTVCVACSALDEVSA